MTMLNNALPLIRVRILPRFPAVVQGANGVSVTKEQGVYTIGPAMEQLVEIGSIPDAGFVSVWDEQGDTYARISASAFVGGGGGGAVNSVNGKTGTVVLVASDIAGVGNMTTAVYDPTSKAGDAFDMTNMVEGVTAKILTATERTKLSGIATGATANSSDATLLNRANHTGTQSADTITDGTTNKAYTATEKTKLAGVASGATANTGTVTSVAVAVPSSLTSTGGPLTTSGTITLAHASGYQGYTTTEATKLSGIASGATANTGTVTSVAMTVPTGLSVSGSAITTSGTLGLTWTAGYRGYTDTEATKLSGIASGATANSSDATLLARANHTGTQSYTTITGLGTLATISYPGGTTNFLRADGTFAAPPGGGSGGGDMYAAVYDPNGVADDAFDMDNMAEGTTSKILTASERTKLSGIATGATANDTDANLKARANHTGTQAASTISDFSTAADARITAAVGVSVQAYDADLTTWSGITPAAGVGTFLATPSSANLRAALTDETGTGAAVFATSPTLVTPVLGAASATSLTLTNDLAIADGGTGASTAAAAFTALKQDASTSATGVVEIATAAEFRALTTGFAVSTDTVSGAMAEVTLTDATTVAWDMSTGFDFVVTLGGNRTLGNPSNTTVGKKGRIRVVQDGTGSRTLALSSNLKTAGGAGITLSTPASSVDFLDYDCVSSTYIRLALSKGWA